jgi:hypothetical protein
VPGNPEALERAAARAIRPEVEPPNLLIEPADGGNESIEQA